MCVPTVSLSQIVIAELMKTNSSVQRLDLARNILGDAGAMALASMLSENSTLEYLNLESNTFGERGACRCYCQYLACRALRACFHTR